MTTPTGSPRNTNTLTKLQLPDFIAINESIDLSRKVNDDYNLTPLKLKARPEPPPRMPPESLRTGLQKEFQNALAIEVNHWGKKYFDPECNGPGEPEFKRKIDAYVECRQQVMELMNTVAPDELEPLFQKLGTMLADAYGMRDPETAEWSQEVKAAIERGAREYAVPSVKSFWITQSPAIAKPLASYLATLFAGDHTGEVKHAINFAYPFVQIPLAIWASQKNGFWQSEAVQLQKRENPTWTPNVVSSKIFNEDGSDGELRLLSHVDEDLAELRGVNELLNCAGVGVGVGALEQKNRQLTGRILLAEHDLLNVLKRVTGELGKSQLSAHKAKLNEIEKRILDKDAEFTTRMNTLASVNSGRAALPVAERQQVKRLLAQLKLWGELREELLAAIETCKAGDTPQPSSKLGKLLTKTAFERMKIFRYRMLNVLTNQATVRDIRTAVFGVSTITQLCGQVAEYVTGNELALVTSEELQAITGVVQALLYSWQYPKATAKDSLNKLATQWQIVAMTGTGNFVKNGKVDPQKLDKAVTGPVMTRLSTFASLLQFDKSVYLQALFGWMVDRRTLDNDEAEKVTVRFKVALPGTKQEKEVEKELACTYACLAEEFVKLKRLEDRDARKAIVDQVAAQRLLSTEDKMKVDRILKLYEDNEVNLANKTDASKLLGEDNSTLPEGTRQILQGSLDFANPKSFKIDSSALDRELFRQAGKIEQRGELPSQAAQKLGQAFAYGVFGTGGFLFIKSFFTLGVEIAMLYGDLTEDAAESLAGGILAGKMVGNAFALASTVFSIGFNHAYHEFIANKNLQRQNAAGGASIVNAPPPSLREGMWRGFKAFVGAYVGIADAREEKITGYETLVATPIPKEDWPPELKFVRQSPLTEAMWEQMFAADMPGSWLAYLNEKHGTLEGKTEAELQHDIRQDIQQLNEMLRSQYSDATAADPPPKEVKIALSSSGERHIEDLERPKPPPLNLAAALGNSTASRPQSPRTHDTLVTPRHVREARKAKRDGSKGDLLRQRRAVHTLYTGASTISNLTPPMDAADIRDLRDPEPSNALDDYKALSARKAQASKPSQLMRALPWRMLGGVYVAQQGKDYFISPDPEAHAHPINAFAIHNEEGGGVLHIRNRTFPSLAVSNMVQLDLGNNKNWETLTTDDEYIHFFDEHLRHASPDPSRLAAMPMEDLASFTQHMALQRGSAWRPMTTAKVRYVPDAEQSPIQSAGTTLPEIHPGHAFGVSYEAKDSNNYYVRNSVMLRFADGAYSVFDPVLSAVLETPYDAPLEALASYMRRISSQHPDVADGFILTVLYHVSPELAIGEQPEVDLVRQRIREAKDSPQNLTFAWLQGNLTVVEIQREMAEACHCLEAENSLLLMSALSLSAGEIIDRVKRNRSDIGILNDAYSKLSTIPATMPPLPASRPMLSDAVLPLIED